MASKPASVRPGAAAIVAALLLPPLGLYLVYGLTRTFWIGVALTCLGWVPGVVFAMVMVLAAKDQDRAIHVPA